MEIRPMRKDEEELSFSSDRKSGLIGHLRADMDSDGNGFYSTWFDCNKDLKTQEFKDKFDEIINTLRGITGNIEEPFLRNRGKLRNYCYGGVNAHEYCGRNNYGVVVTDDKYTFVMRLNPNKGEYNLYCYCYVTELLNAEKVG